MAVLRFDPFRELDRMTEQLLRTPAGSPRTPLFMPMDLYRSGDHYVIHADLPGVDPGSVEVSVDNGTLSIRAERSARTADGVEWLANERFTGSYLRQISLGDDINSEGIVATYDNGVLTVNLPLAERAKPRRIDVAVKTNSEVTIGERSHQAVTAS